MADSRRRLSLQEVQRIKWELSHGRAVRWLAKQYGVAETTIAKIRDGVSWKAVRPRR